MRWQAVELVGEEQRPGVGNEQSASKGNLATRGNLASTGNLASKGNLATKLDLADAHHSSLWSGHAHARRWHTIPTETATVTAHAFT